jgi:hypothetical protein
MTRQKGHSALQTWNTGSGHEQQAIEREREEGVRTNGRTKKKGTTLTYPLGRPVSRSRMTFTSTCPNIGSRNCCNWSAVHCSE